MQETILNPAPATTETAAAIKPKLGFLGVGWIGRNRLEAIAKANIAEILAVADTVSENKNAVLETAPKAKLEDMLQDLLTPETDAVVIATPSALHAKQSIEALQAGKAVFCQKPLGRNAAETKAVVEAAREADLSLGVDLSYRHTAAMQKVYEVLQSGELGQIYAVELTFHNAYGPDKNWFYDPKLSGGGCVIDLGVHLVDLALWGLNFPEVKTVISRLFAKGKPLTDPDKQVEDYASAHIELATGTHVQLTCSWNLQAGQEAQISAIFYGINGGVAFKNVNGSFYDFVAERYYSTRTETLISPPDAWMGRAAVEWTRRLAGGEKFPEDAFDFVKVAEVLDKIYGR